MQRLKTVIGGVLVAAAVATLVAVPFAESAKKHPKHTLKLKYGIGPDQNVRPGDFATATAACPRGYLVTGGGSFAGAIEHVSSGPTPDGKAWFVDGYNPSGETVFSHSVSVVCAKGSRKLRVRRASAESKAKARREFLAVR